MKTKCILVLLLLLNVYAHSQNIKRKPFKIDTVENLGRINKDELIMRARRIPFSMLTDFPKEYIPEDNIYGAFKHNNTFRLNYKIDKDGNVFFIKGNKGFPKVEIPEEFIGLVDNSYCNNDIFLARLNHHISNYKAQHFENGIVQSDCQKLADVVFYCQISFYYIKKK
jgi:hypothetical protein